MEPGLYDFSHLTLRAPFSVEQKFGVSFYARNCFGLCFTEVPLLYCIGFKRSYSDWDDTVNPGLFSAFRDQYLGFRLGFMVGNANEHPTDS